MTHTVFSDFMLKPPLQKAIADAGFTTPTPIQAQSIPGILEGRDAMACAPTGTGKTAAFVLPALNLITSGPSQARGHGPRVLVLTPTRELAEQIITNVKLFSKHSRIASGLIMGGVSYGPQYKLLSNPLDMLVATPGRLIDHLNERKIDLSRVEMLVLDEADRMLDMGFLKPVEKIIAALARKPQTLLFSATFEAEIEKVAQRVLTNPVRVQLAAPKQSHSSITHHAYMVDNTGHKQALLNKLLREKDVQQAIVFTATKRIADQLAEHLHGRGFSASALHGDMKQNARKRTLEGLHKGTLQVLVATDVAARGIDVKNLSHVFNYDLPNAADDFTHRIGRTGRGGSEGIAISLVAPPDLPLLKAIEKRQGKNFNFVSFEGLEPVLSEQDFRALVPTEPPPGRPKPKGQRGGSRPQGGFSGRSFGGNRSEGGRSEGGRSDKPRGFSGGNRSEGRSDYRDNGNRTEGRGERSDNRGNRFEGRSEGRSDSRPDNRFGGRSEGRSDNPRGFSGGKPARREGGNGASRSASSRPARRPSR